MQVSESPVCGRARFVLSSVSLTQLTNAAFGREHGMTGVRLVWVLAWVFFLSTAPVAADVVTFWNNVTHPLSASRAAPAVLDFAMVHLAMHDAIQVYEGRFRTYAYQPTTPPSGSPIAAAAAAAHAVLVTRFPAQTTALNDTFDDYLADNGLTGDPGVVTGQQAAAAVIATGARVDPNPTAPPFVGGTARSLEGHVVQPDDRRPARHDIAMARQCHTICVD